MSRSTHGKGRDDPELVRFVAQPTGKRSHVSENVRVRFTPCVTPDGPSVPSTNVRKRYANNKPGT